MSKGSVFYCIDCMEYKGSWLGLSSHLSGECERSEPIKKNQLKFAIIKTKELLNEVPSAKKMNEKGLVSETPLINSFGSFNNAILESGLIPKNSAKNISEEILVEELKTISREHLGGKTPKVKHVQRFSKFSHQVFTRRFDSWNEAVKEAGFIPNSQKNIKRDKLIQELKRLSKEDCDGNIPRSVDVDEHGKYTIGVLKKTFGSWSNALEKAGFEARECGSWVPSGKDSSRYGVRGEDHPSWKGGYENYYGSSWISQQSQVLKRDHYRCQCCLKSENSMERKPDVHHIDPVRNWDVEKEHEKMNSLDNLICLCRSCHRSLEEKWQKSTSSEFIVKARNLYKQNNELF